MKLKDMQIVQRYIDGEKKLHNKLSEIHAKLKPTDQEFEAAYLRAYFGSDEDVETVMSLKRKIQENTKQKFKPSFTKRNDK